MQETHKSGPFKQENKAHKSRHRSNRAISESNKGKISVKLLSRKKKNELNKFERRNQNNQIRKSKRDEVLNLKRGIGTLDKPPIIVAVIPIVGNDISRVHDLMTCCDDEMIIKKNDFNFTHVTIPRFKTRYQILTPEKDDLFCMLDTAKIADVLVLVYSAYEHLEDYDNEQNIVLNSIYSHCLPTTLHVISNLDELPTKKQSDARKNIKKFIDSKFGNSDKLFTLDNIQQALQLFNQIGNCKKLNLSYRKLRSMVVADKIEFIPDEKENEKGLLKVSGYVRNNALDVNGLVHITGIDDFQMEKIEIINDPFSMNKNKNRNKDIEMDDNRTIKPDENQESLEKENEPDMLDAEQTFPTTEDILAAEAERKKIFKKVPKGTSSYQAAWILDDEECSQVDEDEDDVSLNSDDHDKQFDPIDENSDEEDNQSYMTAVDNDEIETISVNDGGYDEKLDVDEEEKALVKFREERMEELFPDEVDTPNDVPARIRFQKYRGLKSFNTSYIDPMENLPADYAKIFQFENFDRTRKRVFKERKNIENGVDVGYYVNIYIKNFSLEKYNEISSNPRSIILYGLLQHEQKISVNNFAIRKHSSFSEPIKSKEKLIFHVGCRRFYASPIFSAHTNGNKFKYERFLRNDSTIVASVYAPITFPPASVLVFKEYEDGTQSLVASGSLLSVNPNRLVIKRIRLSGHPFKINKNSAVVRYMFFNREDILWFKPIELRSKYARKGHIKEPLGTHGHMKCTFDRQLKSDDTVMMNLYKRVYPKWTYDEKVNEPIKTVMNEDDMNEN